MDNNFMAFAEFFNLIKSCWNKTQQWKFEAFNDKHICEADAVGCDVSIEKLIHLTNDVLKR